MGHWSMVRFGTTARVFGLAALLGLMGAASSTPAMAVGSPSQLTVTVTWGPGVSSTWTLTCDPVGGTHPGRARACAMLESLDQPFAALPTGLACTMIYSGPETARVVGRWAGRPVDRSFSRTNGCETARWHQYRALLTAPGIRTVRGRVDLGPTCPVERPGESCTTVGAPATVTATSGALRRTARSGVEGFTLRLPRGVWRLNADAGMSCATLRIDTRSGAPRLPVVIACDTGIRERRQMS